MLKNRFFLYGLGIGLICGAVLLQLMVKVEQMENSSLSKQQTALPAQQPSAMTLEQLQEQAGKLNMKVVAKEQTIYSDQDIAKIKQQAAEEERSKAAVPNAVPPTIVEQKPSTIRTAYITEQMNAYQVAELLVKAGILPESGTFIANLAKKKLETRIIAGAYAFADQTAVDDIIAAITR
ncbi:MAG: hypothetical protein K0Q59_1098 [Paenibacillus sp.]|nr:hypothetical protein [Paenibacillus sp.]